jgi:hypothetical protein
LVLSAVIGTIETPKPPTSSTQDVGIFERL